MSDQNGEITVYTGETDNSQRVLSEREQRFLEVLMHEARGDFMEAKRLAGFPNNKPIATIIKDLKSEIVETVQLYLAYSSPIAVAKLMEILTSDMPVLNAREKLAAAKEVLDRGGIIKVEKKEVSHTYQGGVALLPPKGKKKVYREEDPSDDDEGGDFE